MFKPKITRQHFYEFVEIVFGSALIAIALAMFLVPAKISCGGISGIATVMHHLLKTPTGLVIIALNIPLFFVGVKYLGSTFGVRTIVGILISSLATDFLAESLVVAPITVEPLLASVFGGLILGAGLGFIFRAGGSTGGSDIVGTLIARHSNVSTGQAMMFIDVFVIAGSGMAFGSAELALWGIIALFTSSATIDIVMEGLSYARVVNIISDHNEQIASRILSEMNRGDTIIPAVGAFTGENRTILMIVLTRKELSQLKKIIRDIDPTAFTYVSDVYAVMGEGFKSRGKAF